MGTLPLALAKCIYNLLYNFISYKLPRVLRQKDTIIWKCTPFLLKDQGCFLLSCLTIFVYSSGMKLLYLHARNALDQSKQKACLDRQCGKARNTDNN